MSWALAAGYQPEHHLWQLLVGLILGWSILLNIAHLTMRSTFEPYDLPIWMLALGGLGTLSIITDTGLVIVLTLHLYLYISAPLSVCILCTLFSMEGLWAFFQPLLAAMRSR